MENQNQMVFGVGKVVSVNPLNKDGQGNDSPAINVKSFEDGSILSIPVAGAAWEQNLPVIAMTVLFVRFGGGRHQNRIVKMWGNDADYSRKGKFALNAGEVFIQSPSGLGFVKIDRNGRVTIVSGDTTSSFDMSDEGTILRTPTMTIDTKAGVIIQILEDSTYKVERVDTDGTIKSSFTMDADDNIIVEAKGDLTLKAKNIYLDGKIFEGPGASDPAQRALFGDVVTGGPAGTYKFDLPVGAPVIGSGNVKAAF